MQCLPLNDGIIKRNPGLLTIIVIEKSLRDGKISSKGGSNLEGPASMLTSAWKLEADLATGADYTGTVHHLQHLKDFEFLARRAEEKRVSYHELFLLASSKVNVTLPPFTIQDFQARVCTELSLLKEKITPSELPNNVRFKRGTILHDINENEEETDLFNIKRSLNSAPSEMSLKGLVKIINKGDIFIETTVMLCGTGNGYAAGSWFLLEKVKEPERTFILRGPVEESYSVMEVKQARKTQLYMSSFIVGDPALSEELSPPLEI